LVDKLINDALMLRGLQYTLHSWHVRISAKACSLQQLDSERHGVDAVPSAVIERGPNVGKQSARNQEIGLGDEGRIRIVVSVNVSAVYLQT
jgi:hypothetical protein